MTVSNQPSVVGPTIGTGTVAIYNFPYRVDEAEYLRVRLVTLADDTQQDLQLNTDFTISGSGPPYLNGVDITLTAGNLANTKSIIIWRVTAPTQESNFGATFDFAPQAVEDMADRQMLLFQENARDTKRSLKVPVEVDGADGELVETPQDAKGLKWSATLKKYVNTTYDPDTQATLATTKATAAAASASEAAGSASSASASSTSAAASAVTATNQASAASTSAASAAASATAAAGLVAAAGLGTVTNVATSGLATGGPITTTGTVSVPAAAISDVRTGTDTAKAVTPDALAMLWEQGSAIASASTITIPTTGGGYFHITGTTTITALSEASSHAGREVALVFDGILTLTHNATSLILPTGANITTAAGDTARFRLENTSSNWRCIGYQRKDGTALTSLTTYKHRGYNGGGFPVYTSASTYTIPAGFAYTNASDVQFVAAGNLAVALSASGALGLDTGSEASSTHYYLYMIRKSSDGTVSALWSATNETATGAITLPSGYDQKAQLPIAARNDGSSNFIASKVLWMTGNRAKLRYNVPTSLPLSASNGSVTAGALNILNNGTTAGTTISATSNLVPGIGLFVDLWTRICQATGWVYEDGTTNYVYVGNQNAASPINAASSVLHDLPVSASQLIGYNNNGGHGISLDVLGYLAEVA